MIMSFFKTILTMLLLSAALLAAGAVEEKALPLKMSEVAEALQKKTTGNAKVEARQDTLVITVDGSGQKGGFDGTYSFHSFKRLAGYTFTFMIDVKLENIDRDGAALPGNIGQIHFGESRQLISAKHTDWHTYTFKNVKFAGSGLLKMRIMIKKSLSGEIHIRNPRIKGNFPKVRDNSANKKKKKKRNNE